MHKSSGRKGISVFTSHILAIAILFVILTVVSTSLFSYYYSVKEESQEAQALVLSQRVADNVVNLYNNYRDSEYEPAGGKNNTLSVVYLNIPEKISGSSYTLSLEQNEDFWIEGSMENESFSRNERPYTSVKVEIENPYAVYTYPVYNVVSNVSGSVRRATKIKLSYVRGSEEDYIIMERFS